MTAIDDSMRDARRSARFWDRTADRYLRTPIADQAAYETKLEITREYLRPEMQLLEIGCGTGSTAITHASRVRHILATDVSPRMIEIGRERAAAAGVTNLTFRCAAVEELSAPDAGFDGVLALSLLHLLRDRDAAMARVFRLLKPGGVFITSTACLADGMGWFALIAPIGKALGFFPPVRVFSQTNLVEGLRRNGFRIEREWRPGKGPSVFIVAVKPDRVGQGGGQPDSD